MTPSRPTSPSHGAPKVVSQQAIRILGSLTAALLLVVLASDLRSNLRAQWNESGRLAHEVALSAAQMVHVPLKSSANALLVIAEESQHLQQTLPHQHDALMKNIIAAVVRRQPQVVDVALADAAPGGETAAFPKMATAFGPPAAQTSPRRRHCRASDRSGRGLTAVPCCRLRRPMTMAADG